MKHFFIFVAAVIPFLSFGATHLICNDQNSHAVYELVLENNLKLIPLVKDSGVLSADEVVLKFNEGEVLFEGKNRLSNKIVLEMNLDEINGLTSNRVIIANLTYSNSHSKELNQKTDFLCSLK